MIFRQVIDILAIWPEKEETFFHSFFAEYTDVLYILAKRRTGGPQCVAGLHNAIGHITFRLLSI
jgi:hypothetical protein